MFDPRQIVTHGDVSRNLEATLEKLEVASAPTELYLISRNRVRAVIVTPERYSELVAAGGGDKQPAPAQAVPEPTAA